MRPFESIGEFRDLFEGIFYVCAALAVLGGGYRYFRDQNATQQQRRDDLDQRRRELRWRQANASKELLDGLLGDPAAGSARQMLDSWDRDFELKGQRPTGSASSAITRPEESYSRNERPCGWSSSSTGMEACHAQESLR